MNEHKQDDRFAPLAFAPETPLWLEPDALAEDAARPAPAADAFALFGPDGHLTGPGLAALAAGTLDEIGRFEAAEHLGFCGACMNRYTALLTGEALLAPPADLVLPVARRVRRRGVRVNLRRYAAAAAAAALALGLWGSGAFAQMVPQAVELAAPPTQTARIAQPDPGERLGGRVSEALNGLFGAAGDWCGGLFAARAPKPAPAVPDASGGAGVRPDEADASGKPGEDGGKTPNAAAPAQDEADPAQNAAPDDADARAPLTGAQIGARPDTPDTAREGWLGAQSPARTPASAMRGEE